MEDEIVAKYIGSLHAKKITGITHGSKLPNLRVIRVKVYTSMILRGVLQRR
jgi:hypothetical protein